MDGVGRDGELADFRDLTYVGAELYAITGDVDSSQSKSLLIEDYPGGRNTVSTHWRVALTEDQGYGDLDATPIREFPGLPALTASPAPRTAATSTLWTRTKECFCGLPGCWRAEPHRCESRRLGGHSGHEFRSTMSSRWSRVRR